MAFELPEHGAVCWRELTTQNVDAAKAFYAALLGWQIEKSQTSATPYEEIHTASRAIGGMLQINAQWGENWQRLPAYWMTYIAVENCDAAVEKIKENGGAVHVGPFDAPGVGRMAIAADPSGAAFSIMQFQTPNSETV